MTNKILVVDDEPDMVEMLRLRLENNGYDVMTAIDGESCLEKAAEKNPDLILLDVLLPGISGFEVCRRLKENDKTKNIPVIMVTALIGDEVKGKGLGRGAKFFISKPLDPDELLSEIKSVFKTKKEAYDRSTE